MRRTQGRTGWGGPTSGRLPASCACAPARSCTRHDDYGVNIPLRSHPKPPVVGFRGGGSAQLQRHGDVRERQQSAAVAGQSRLSKSNKRPCMQDLSPGPRLLLDLGKLGRT
eukprot:141912-Chlamydomonas_euryale.AAC.4